jgi:hypothetical protein
MAVNPKTTVPIWHQKLNLETASGTDHHRLGCQTNQRCERERFLIVWKEASNGLATVRLEPP